MSQLLKPFMEQHIPVIEEKLYELVKPLCAPPSLIEAMIYSLEAGGKRVRPLFVLAVLDIFKKDVHAGYVVGAAVEMIHTYSLIHDDLPSMDNDDFRRGKPTNHKVFGEGMAVLSGDALNSLAFGVLARLQQVSAEKRLALIELLSVTAGAEGMVGGQVLDMEGEQRSLNLTELEQVHMSKTGALLRFSIESGAILADATVEERRVLVDFAHHIGLCFQIQDDILDIEGTTEQLGKTAGKDIASEKSTYPALLTLQGAKDKLQYHYKQAIAALDRLTGDTALLRAFA